MPAKAQNDSSLLSVHFHILGVVVLPAQHLPGARCHMLTVQIPAWQQLLLRAPQLREHPYIPSLSLNLTTGTAGCKTIPLQVLRCAQVMQHE